jgi:hypothetical protein
MNYVEYRNQKKGIPSIVALFLVVFFALGLVFVIQKKPVQLNFKQTPRSDIQLERTLVGNLRDNTATIYWRTEQPSQGYILFGSDPTNITEKFFDNTETESNIDTKKDHLITMANLDANNSYYYFIMVDGKKVGQSADSPFQLRTTNGINSLFIQKPIFGRLFTASRHIIPNAILIVSVDGAEPVMTVTKGDGTYSFPPCCVKKDSLTDVILPKADTTVSIEVINEESIKKEQYTFGFLTENNEIYLGQPEKTQIAQKNGIQTNFLLPAKLVEKIADIDIIFPRKNAVIPDTKPLIKGVGEPGKEVHGKVLPDGKLFSVTISDKGQWNHSFGTELSAGPHSLSIETTDAENRKVALSRSFTILKSGEAVLGESTPEATLAPTESPITPTAGPTLAPTDIPLTPTPGDITGLPSDMPTKPPPVTGSNIVPFATMSIVLIMIGIGALLFY